MKDALLNVCDRALLVAAFVLSAVLMPVGVVGAIYSLMYAFGAADAIGGYTNEWIREPWGPWLACVVSSNFAILGWWGWKHTAAISRADSSTRPMLARFLFYGGSVAGAGVVFDGLFRSERVFDAVWRVFAGCLAIWAAQLLSPSVRHIRITRRESTTTITPETQANGATSSVRSATTDAT